MKVIAKWDENYKKEFGKVREALVLDCNDGTYLIEMKFFEVGCCNFACPNPPVIEKE